MEKYIKEILIATKFADGRKSVEMDEKGRR
jgi:hypothetical protein